MGNLLKKLSLLAVLGFPLSLIGYRMGAYDFGVGFAGIKYTVYLTLAVFVLGLLVMFLQRKRNPSESKAAMHAVLISLIPMIGIGSQIMTAKSVPSIHNISTDTVNPPEFSRIAEIRTSEHNPLEYDASKLAALQNEAYPEVKTIYSELSLPEAHGKALVVAEALGWEVVNQDVVTGIIEATETTKLWNFKDDIVIRVTGVGGVADGETIAETIADSDNIAGSENKRVAVDLRSVSRIGQSDLGANAKRIEKFIDGFNR